MAKLTLEGQTLTVTEDDQPSRKVSLPLDALRLVFLLVPAGHSLADSDAERSFIDLDALTQDEYSDLVARLSSEPDAELRLFLEDYVGRYASISLQDVHESGVDLLAELGQHRSARRDKLANWSRNPPGLIITGAKGDNVTLNIDGVRAGSHGFVAWDDLARVDVRSGSADTPSTYRFVPHRGGVKAFSVRIPRGKSTLFAAEFTFWRALAQRHAENPHGRAGIAPTSIMTESA